MWDLFKTSNVRVLTVDALTNPLVIKLTFQLSFTFFLLNRVALLDDGVKLILHFH